VKSVRVVDVIPGKSVVGLEIPNTHREMIYLSELLRSKEYDKSPSPLTIALGKDIGGRPGGRGPHAHAAPAGRRHHRLGQVGGHQRHGAEPAVQGQRQGREDADDRPEDAGAVGLRGHPAPAGAGGHRHEGGRQRPALVRGRDGAPLQGDEHARRAQPRRLQPQGAGGGGEGPADHGPAVPPERGPGEAPRRRKSCPTSSCSSTNSPT
jgi:hypothetical protein